MNKKSRLAGLLLMMAMLLCAGVSALADTGAVTTDELDINTWNMWLMAASLGADDAIGKTAVVNSDNVPVYDNLQILLWPKDRLSKETEVTILDVAHSWIDGFIGTKWYKVQYGDAVGYIQQKYLDIVEDDDNTVTAEPWTPGQTEYPMAFEVAGAQAYQWQRGLITESGEIVWENIEGATGASYALDTASADSLRYAYRCVALGADNAELAVSEPAKLVRDDIALWIAEGTTDEMIARAVATDSLDSVVIEENALVHVRSGEVYATVDEETGVVTHAALNIEFGVLRDGAIHPITEQLKTMNEQIETLSGEQDNLFTGEQ